MKISYGVFCHCLALLLGIVFFAPQARAVTPAQAVENIGTAMNNGDVGAFEELVDVDTLLDDCLAVFLREARKPENAAQMPPLVALMFTQAGAEGAGGERLRNILRSEAKAFVRNGIGSGAFAGKQLSSGQASGILAPLFSNASIGRKEIRGIGEPKRDGVGWLVPFSVHDYGNDHDYQIVGRLSPVDDSWRMTGIENLEQLLTQIHEESKEQ